MEDDKSHFRQDLDPRHDGWLAAAAAAMLVVVLDCASYLLLTNDTPVPFISAAMELGSGFSENSLIRHWYQERGRIIIIIIVFVVMSSVVAKWCCLMMTTLTLLVTWAHSHLTPLGGQRWHQPHRTLSAPQPLDPLLYHNTLWRNLKNSSSQSCRCRAWTKQNTDVKIARFISFLEQKLFLVQYSLSIGFNGV